MNEALHAVVMEAHMHGVSTRKVDDLVTAMGAEAGISKSEVSKICARCVRYRLIRVATSKPQTSG